MGKNEHNLSLFRHNFYIFFYFLINVLLLVRRKEKERRWRRVVNREACIKENNLWHSKYFFHLEWQVIRKKQINIDNFKWVQIYTIQFLESSRVVVLWHCHFIVTCYTPNSGLSDFITMYLWHTKEKEGRKEGREGGRNERKKEGGKKGEREKRREKHGSQLFLQWERFSELEFSYSPLPSSLLTSHSDLSYS